MQKDCQAEGIAIPQTIMVKDPVAHMLTPQEYVTESGSWTNASDGQPSDDERTGGKE